MNNLKPTLLNTITERESCLCKSLTLFNTWTVCPICHFECYLSIIHCQTYHGNSPWAAGSSWAARPMSSSPRAQRAEKLGSSLSSSSPWARCSASCSLIFSTSAATGGGCRSRWTAPSRVSSRGSILSWNWRGELEESIMRRRKRECVEGAGFGFLIAGWHFESGKILRYHVGGQPSVALTLRLFHYKFHVRFH